MINVVGQPKLATSSSRQQRNGRREGSTHHGRAHVLAIAATSDASAATHRRRAKHDLWCNVK
jgi:hypothetical protein